MPIMAITTLTETFEVDFDETPRFCDVKEHALDGLLVKIGAGLGVTNSWVRTLAILVQASFVWDRFQ